MSQPDPNPYTSPPAMPDAAPPPLPLDSTAAEPPRPWGPLLTILWCLLAAVAFLVVQLIVFFPYLVYRAIADPNRPLDQASLEGDGLLLGLSTVLGMPAAIAVLVAAVAVRRCPQGWYFAFVRSRAGQAAIATGVLLGLMMISDAISLARGKPVVPEFMQSAVQPPWVLPLVILAVVIVAPVCEEMFFRGFLHRGLTTRFGWPETVVVTSALWAVLHFQYDDWVQTSTIFVGGLFLGAVRQWTGSLVLVIWLHALTNLLATLQALAVVYGGVKFWG